MKLKHPELSDIALELFGPDWDLVEQWRVSPDSLPSKIITALENSALAQIMHDIADENDMDSIEGSTAEEVVQPKSGPNSVPPAIRDLARNSFGLEAIQRESMPQSGQVVVMDSLESPDLEIEVLYHVNRPLAALIYRPTDHEDVWAGWVVAPEKEKYFSSVWDVHMEEEDRPYLNSLAGVVQVWNPVKVYLPRIKKVIGKLSASRLAAIHELQMVMFAMEFEYEEESPIGQTEQIVMSDANLTIGTPLSSESDPRVQYQRIYSEVANAIKQPALISTELSADEITDLAVDVGTEQLATVSLPVLSGKIENFARDAFRAWRDAVIAWVDAISGTPNVELAYGPRGASHGDDDNLVIQTFYLGYEKSVEITFKYAETKLTIDVQNNDEAELSVKVEEKDGTIAEGKTAILGKRQQVSLEISLPDTLVVIIETAGQTYRFPITE